MQSPTAATFSLKDEFTLDKPNRHIDKLIQTKTVYKKVIVIAEKHINLTEYSGLLQQLGFKVYDDAEALRRDHRQYWLEAAQAKDAGKPYGHSDWNKLLGEYDAIVAHIAMPFAKELIDHRNISNYYTKVMVVTKSDLTTLFERGRCFLFNTVLPYFDTQGLGLLARIKGFSNTDLSYVDTIRSFVTGREQKFLTLSSYDVKVACDFLGTAAPPGSIKVAESAELLRLRHLSDRIGIHYISPLNQVLIASALAMAALVMGYFFTPLASLAIPLVIAGLFGLEMAVASSVKRNQDRVAALAPHIKNDYKLPERPALPAVGATQAVTKPVAPHHKKTSPARPNRFKPRGCNGRKYNNAPVSAAHPRSQRAPVSAPGWGNVLETIQASDEKARVERDARNKATEGKPLGVWTEKHGARYVKAVSTKIDGQE